MNSLIFGTAGIPLSTEPRNTLEGIRQVKRLGLGAMELEFVHSVNIKEENAPLVKKRALEEGVVLTCHGQYYINLNAGEKEKREASLKRLLNAARTAALCGAWSVCFHAAYYMGKPKEQAYQRVKEALVRTKRQLDDWGLRIWLRPEIGGKKTQFGGLEELVSLSAELEGVLPCMDYAHYHAREGGKKTRNDFAQTLEYIEKHIGKEAVKQMHIHCEGIVYGPGGEKSHTTLKASDVRYADLLQALKDFSAKGVLISESPNIEEDALLMKKTYDRLSSSGNCRTCKETFLSQCNQTTCK